MRIALLGDIALFGKNTARSRDWRHRFLGIRDILHGCDFVIGNLETPLTAGTRTVGGKSAYIKGFPEDAEILKYLGVSHVSLANNHIFDYGARGLSDTVSCLEQNGIAWYGINGKSIELGNCAVLSGFCCYSTNAAGLDRRTDFVNLLDPPEMEKAIRQAEEKNLLPILSCHWGEEHVHFPNYDHVELARGLARKHTIVVHGTHPHVIQGTETVGESLIHYSLGNFCFDDVYTSRSKDPLIRLSLDNQGYITRLSPSALHMGITKLTTQYRTECGSGPRIWMTTGIRTSECETLCCRSMLWPGKEAGTSTGIGSG